MEFVQRGAFDIGDRKLEVLLAIDRHANELRVPGHAVHMQVGMQIHRAGVAGVVVGLLAVVVPVHRGTDTAIGGAIGDRRGHAGFQQVDLAATWPHADGAQHPVRRPQPIAHHRRLDARLQRAVLEMHAAFGLEARRGKRHALERFASRFDHQPAVINARVFGAAGVVLHLAIAPAAQADLAAVADVIGPLVAIDAGAIEVVFPDQSLRVRTWWHRRCA